MPRYAFRIEYHGHPFSGWQRQTHVPSVQEAVETALRRLDPGLDAIAAAGRTDAGVHATGQVAHADLARDWTPFRLMEAVNYHLKPDPVAVTAVAAVTADWHARFSAIERRYLYRILVRRAPLVHDAGLAWQVRHPLDAEAMAEGARRLLGQHDFTTFRSTMCQAKSPVKTLDLAQVETRAAGPATEIRLTFHARSFLHNQIRSFAGTLERVGSGAWSPDDVSHALAARDRAACGPVAPPQGLYLTHVGYPEDPFTGS
ncbi:tRNA pseudouridine(38-40) synthase TruA [Mesobaculum littorinae]|uniref:tRNA pseudouridine synthase A n=1 Tax=Mesobaculum littorinae TaxID=2486419 RepID=A0A438AIG0_9RHOB|nr:tRNA pseudouridine(38-40) synthase TruA [Mesobaculum littorinae]RVV98480.1 tRNA pseudouridine(38-40) synthase TruA [Mesobaculum littorinae]